MNYKSYFRGALVICGILTIGLATALIYIINNPAPQQPQVPDCNNTIVVDSARACLARYIKSNLGANGVRAIVLERADYDAMTCIVNSNTGTNGFRLYMGLTASGSLIRSVVGVFPNGSDNVSRVFRVNATTQALCPPICDAASPIMVR